LETVLVSVQDRCTVCAKCTIGSEISLDAPDGTLGHKAQVEARLGPFGASANLGTR
jgi:CBS-domain-containing membrane protein